MEKNLLAARAEFINKVVNTTSALEMHGYLQGHYLEDTKGKCLKAFQPKVYKYFLNVIFKEYLTNNGDSLRESVCNAYAVMYNRMKREGLENQFKYWFNHGALSDISTGDKSSDKVNFYLGLSDTKVTSSMNSLSKSDIDNRGLTLEESIELIPVLGLWCNSCCGAESWVSADPAPSSLAEKAMEVLSSEDYMKSNFTSRLQKEAMAYEPDLWDLEMKNLDKPLRYQPIPTKEQAIRLGSELKDLVNGFDAVSRTIVEKYQDRCQGEYQYLPADITLSDMVKDLPFEDLIDQLWEIGHGPTSEMMPKDVSSTAFYLVKAYNNIYTWENGKYLPDVKAAFNAAGPGAIKGKIFLLRKELNMVKTIAEISSDPEAKFTKVEIDFQFISTLVNSCRGQSHFWDCNAPFFRMLVPSPDPQNTGPKPRYSAIFFIFRR